MPTELAIKELTQNEDVQSTSMEEAWEAEKNALDTVDKLNHQHIVRRIAAIKRGDIRYFLFPLADGGNLHEFWATELRPELTTDRMKEVILQLRGIADAIHQFYSPLNRICHGDIKLENILVFNKNMGWLDTLKIADLGLAKHHAVATELRPHGTSTRYRTIAYEAPEAVTSPSKALTRLYDIWSLGCVAIELLIWLLYGYLELKRFKIRVEGNMDNFGPTRNASYFEQGEDGPHVHPTVIVWMDHMSKDPECKGDTSMKDLLHIVRHQLLVVNLPSSFHEEDTTHNDIGSPLIRFPEPEASSIRPTRAGGRALVKSLDDIIAKADKRKGYLYSGKTRDNLRGPADIAPDHGEGLAPPGSTQRRRDKLPIRGMPMVSPPLPLGSSQIVGKTMKIS